MNKKTVGITLMIIVLIGSSITPVIATENKIPDLIQIIEDSTQTTNSTRTTISSYGPLAKRITEITIHDGPEYKVRRLERIVKRKALQYLRPVTIMLVSDLNFTIKFKRDIILPRSTLSYSTMVIDYVNGSRTNTTTIQNDMHTANLKGFTGFFLFTRGKLLRLRPALHQPRFMFSGTCEQMTIFV